MAQYNTAKTEKVFNVVWDVSDNTKVKTYGSRWAAFDKFKELCGQEGVVQVSMQREDGYVLHVWERN